MKKAVLALLLVILAAGAGCNRVFSERRPIIGITSVFEQSGPDSETQMTVKFTYIQAVIDNGGVPVALPTIREGEAIARYVAELDGLVLIGGLDIPPDAYGQQPNETVKVMPKQRYEFEHGLIKQWLATGKPTLGVCLGMQLTNVVSGGTLIQDIPSQVGKKIVHRGKNSWHSVRIENGSRLARILGSETADVYSSHHQAVNKLGRGLKAVAYSSDGVVEALERTDGSFGLFVQWHPEAMMKDLAHRDAIYSALVEACQ